MSTPSKPDLLILSLEIRAPVKIRLSTIILFASVTQNEYELYRILQQEAANCTNLGVQLRIPLGTLRQLESHNATKKTISACFRDMCEFWLKNAEDRRWEVVYKALEACGNRALKSQLEKKYPPHMQGKVAMSI